jgi:hypothetical protein
MARAGACGWLPSGEKKESTNGSLILYPSPQRWENGHSKNWACQGPPSCTWTSETPLPTPTFEGAFHCGLRLPSVDVRSVDPSSETGSNYRRKRAASFFYLGSCNDNGAGWPNTSKNEGSSTQASCHPLMPLSLTYPLSCCMSLPTLPFYEGTGWSFLPLPNHEDGINTKLQRCAGCHESFGQDHLPGLECVYPDLGIPFRGPGIGHPVWHPLSSRLLSGSPPLQNPSQKWEGLLYSSDSRCLHFPQFCV